MNTIRMHAHDVVNYARCRRKDYYSRVKGWEVPSIGRKGEIGTLFHGIVAALYTYRVASTTKVEVDEDYVQSLAYEVGRRRLEEGVVVDSEDVILAADMALFHWNTVMANDDVAEVLSAEDELILPVEFFPNERVEVTCRPDLIFRDTSGVVHLRDHKTKDSLPSDYSWFDMDPQMMIYQLVARRYGWTPCKVEHNLIRREVPPGFGHRPLYIQGVDKRGRQYNRKSTASTNPQDYYRMFSFQKSVETLDAYEAEIHSFVDEMLHHHTPRRAVSDRCGYCSYQTVCNRELAGETVSDDEAKLLFTVSLV